MTMTTAETLKNRLATIHKDMCDLSQAVSYAADDVALGRATIAATIERRLTDKLEGAASRLDRMVKAENIGNIGVAVYDAAMLIVRAFLHQRHNCRRNRITFIAHGSAMSSLIASGVFQQLIAKRKAAKAAVEAEQATIAPGIQAEQAATEIPAKLDTTAMMEADAMKAVEGFDLNPKTVVETMTRVAGAVRRDGLTRDQITADVLAAYMEADRKTQEKMFMDYMTNPETRKKAQAAILDVLEQQEKQKAEEVAALKRQMNNTSTRFINEWVIWSDRDNNAILINRDQTPAPCSPLTAPEQNLCAGKAVAEMMGCRLVRRHRAIKMRLAHLEK